MGIEAQLQAGRPGQFDVMVDGERLELRRKSFWERLLTGRWPDPEDVVERLKARQATV